MVQRDNLSNVIGCNLKRYRKRIGYSQEEVAEFLSIDRSIVSLFESGRKEVTLPILKRLSDLFGIDIANLTETNPVDFEINISLSIGKLNPEDKNSVSDFIKLVKNYLKMKSIERLKQETA